jgi:lipopolysaccharide transport system ATP-binding protein
MSSEPAGAPSPANALDVSELGKCYHIYPSPRARLKQVAARFTKKNYYREFWALRGVTFHVPKGQTVGVVGRNGSGKSTLLQMIAGTLTPTEGTVAVRGRVAALLELGAGFNPEFSGRENVYMNAAILGLTKREVDERFGAIVAFADIGDFVDRPVKTYSSGMFVRLAFSVAINVDPDILIVDEALAVGDIRFQARCFRKFEEFQSSGKTILFVSHSTEHIVRHCNHAILLDKGTLVAQGEPREISNQYKDLVFGSRAAAEGAEDGGGDVSGGVPQIRSGDPAAMLAAFKNPASPAGYEMRAGYNSMEYRWGNRSVSVEDYLIHTPEGIDTNQIESGAEMDLYIRVRFDADVERPIFGLAIKSTDGMAICGINSKDWDGANSYRACKKGEVIVVKFHVQVLLTAGDYLLSIGTSAEQGGETVPLDRRYDSVALHVRGKRRAFGIVNLPAKLEILPAG